MQLTLADELGVSVFEAFGVIPAEVAVPFLLFVAFLFWLNPSSA